MLKLLFFYGNLCQERSQVSTRRNRQKQQTTFTKFFCPYIKSQFNKGELSERRVDEAKVQFKENKLEIYI